MAILNSNWYSAQSTRRYPLDDRATGTDDNGARLKDDILVDCQLRFPRTAGNYAYVGGITITDNLVAITILAAETPEDTDGFTPLAVISLPQPVQRHIHYPITPMQTGVGGFIVFGDVSEAFVGRFATPQQSLLLPRCAAAYDPLPVRSIRKGGRATGLTGVVQLRAGADIQIARETRVVDSVSRPVLVFRLAQQVTNRNVLEVYLGPCDQRPESRNCDREGVETINGVGPDCDGNINIRFAGLTARPYDTCTEELPSVAGVTLDQSIGMDEICPETETPGRFAGRDLCPVSSSSMSSESVGGFAPVMARFFAPHAHAHAPLIETSSLSVGDVEWLPMEILFDATPPPLQQVFGDFVLETASGVTACVGQDTARRNVALLPAGLFGRTLDLRFSAELSLGRSSSRANGGLILNYRTAAQTLTGFETYFAVLLDRYAGKVRLLRWTGTGFIDEHSEIVRDPLVFDHKYRLTAEIRTLGTYAAVQVLATGVTQPSWSRIRFSVGLSHYLPAEGRFGIGSDRSVARFYGLKAEGLD